MTDLVLTQNFIMPSFSRGVARLAGVNAKLKNYRYNDDADTAALAQDWKLVGQDIISALKNYEQSNRPNPSRTRTRPSLEVKSRK